MNERIKELAHQADLVIKKSNGNDFRFGAMDPKLEKFAELIVHQMLEITDAHTEVFQTDRDKTLIEHIKKSVKQHFGVE